MLGSLRGGSRIFCRGGSDGRLLNVDADGGLPQKIFEMGVARDAILANTDDTL